MRVVAGAAIGIGLTAFASHLIRAHVPGISPWLVAPLGASTVLVFGVPASPMAQPWPVVAGNTLSALIGIACVHLFGSSDGSAAVAVAAAIGLMFALRCLHPPGGASALLVTLTGVTNPMFALFPVLINSILLVGAGLAYNNLTRRSYPHLPISPPKPQEDLNSLEALNAELDKVLSRYNQVLDISRDDLRALLEDAHLQTYQRRLADIRCADIMSRGLITVPQDSSLAAAWDLFAVHRVKALPVVDTSGSLTGIVTPADFLRLARQQVTGGAEPRKRAHEGSMSEDKKVKDIMTRQVRVAHADRHLAELIPLFGGTGHHHIPIVDEQGRLVGMLTESDVVAALCQPG